jgi:Carboxypeptidase regulatory-like domain
MLPRMVRRIFIAVLMSIAVGKALPAARAQQSATQQSNPSQATAQQTPTATVTIDVRDRTGAAVPHAKIRLQPPPNPLPAVMETDEAGTLALRLPNGSYALFVSASGFQTASQHVDVTSGQTSIATQLPVRVMLEVAHTSGPVPVYPKDSLVLNAMPYAPVMAYSPEEFRALPHVTVSVHNAHSNSDESYSGVPLASLFAKFNVPLGKNLRGEALTAYVLASGTDGYTVLLSLAEVDPNFHSGQVLVVDTRNGQPLGDHGPFQLIVSDDKRPARWVHNLDSIVLQIAN